MHDTIEKFGGLANEVHQLGPWRVLLRPSQVTIGSLVLIHSADDLRHLGEIPANDFALLADICNRIETTLRDLFGAQKFNYLALMMVDPHVHFHVLGRYEHSVSFAGTDWSDQAWPGPANIAAALPFDQDQFTSLRQLIKDRFAKFPS